MCIVHRQGEPESSATGGSLAGPGFSFPEVTLSSSGRSWQTGSLDEVLAAPVGDKQALWDKIYERVEPHLGLLRGCLVEWGLNLHPRD